MTKKTPKHPQTKTTTGKEVFTKEDFLKALDKVIQPVKKQERQPGTHAKKQPATHQKKQPAQAGSKTSV